MAGVRAVTDEPVAALQPVRPGRGVSEGVSNPSLSLMITAAILYYTYKLTQRLFGTQPPAAHPFMEIAPRSWPELIVVPHFKLREG